MTVGIGTKKKSVFQYAVELNQWWIKQPKFIRIIIIPVLLSVLTVLIRLSDSAFTTWVGGILIVALASAQSLLNVAEADIIKSLARKNARYQFALTNIDYVLSKRTAALSKLVNSIGDANKFGHGLTETFDKTASLFLISSALRATLQSMAQERFQGEAITLRVAIIVPTSGTKFSAIAFDETSGGDSIVREIDLLDSCDDAYVATRLWKDQNRRIISVSDTMDGKSFKFLYDQQNAALKSLLCYKIWSVSDLPFGMICIDTNQNGMFPLETDADEMVLFRQLMESFERRILYEININKVISHISK